MVSSYLYKRLKCVCWFVARIAILYTFNVHILWLYPFKNGECAFFGAYTPCTCASRRVRRHCVCAKPRKKFRDNIATETLRTRMCAPNPEQRLLEIPFWPGPSGRANIKSYGAILWNTLPPQLRLIPTQSQFRQILKCLELPGY